MEPCQAEVASFNSFCTACASEHLHAAPAQLVSQPFSRGLKPLLAPWLAAERKPVGYANCMLSVANFNEALRVPQVRGCTCASRHWVLFFGQQCSNQVPKASLDDTFIFSLWKCPTMFIGPGCRLWGWTTRLPVC